MATQKINPQAVAEDNGALRYNARMGNNQDPSALTTQQLLRENFWLRELLESRIAALEALIQQGDKAVQLLQTFADRTPTTMDVQHEVVALREVTMEKLSGIKTQILERDAQTEKASRNLDAQTRDAFAAAKEAVGEQNKSNALAIAKQEAAFTKQIDMLGETNKTNMKGVDDKISDIKERITIIESKTSISDPSTAITLAKLDATVARLSSTTDVSGGRSAGMIALWGLVAGGVALALSVGTFVVLILKFAKP